MQRAYRHEAEAGPAGAISSVGVAPCWPLLRLGAADSGECLLRERQGGDGEGNGDKQGFHIVGFLRIGQDRPPMPARLSTGMSWRSQWRRA